MLALDSVHKTYGDVEALEGVTLQLGGGEFHCLLGPNGSGKTTLFRLVLGLTNPTAGSLSAPDSLGCGFQRPKFYPGLTVRENIEVFASLVDAPDSEWRQHLVSELRLGRALDRRAADLSGGFARKLDLTLALLKRPEVLLLDEPLGALDDISTERLLAFLDEYTDAGHTVVVSTHQVADFEPYIDRVTVMHEGRVLLDRERDGLDLGDAESLQEFYVQRVLEETGGRGDR